MPLKILIIEDSETKFAAIQALVLEEALSAQVVHAPTVVEAEQAISKDEWSAVILDISMDIAPSRLGHRSRGQANIGGLAIAQKMFLTAQEYPTIIVTAFDAFKTSDAIQSNSEIVGFEEIERRASSYLSDRLVACLQYNSSNWKSDFRVALRKALQQ